MILYRKFGLTAKDAAEITADIVEIIRAKMSDERAVEFLKSKYGGNKLIFAVLMLGRLIGMSFALREGEKARAILMDFSRLVDILEKKGKAELIKTLEREIIEEAYEELERFRGYA